eukprot:12865186-Heterocapsa_arctica.AAC.1
MPARFGADVVRVHRHHADRVGVPRAEARDGQRVQRGVRPRLMAGAADLVVTEVVEAVLEAHGVGDALPHGLDVGEGKIKPRAARRPPR